MKVCWPRVDLDSLTVKDRSITYGVVKPGEEVEGGVAFVRGGDIFQGRIALGTLRTIAPQLSQIYKRTILRGGELLISLVGNPGEVAIAPQSLEGANIARQVGLIALRPELDSRFVMYFLQSPLGRAEIFSRTGGAVQQVINLADLKTLRVPVPSTKEQRQIADVLAAYDDLIENNRRRMALLEESARLLYREWFVRLRFPGHEHTRITDGVPTGWQTTDLSAVCMPKIGIQTGPFGSQLHQSDYAEEGFPVVMPKDIIGSTISTESIARVPEAICNRLPRHILQEGDIVLARRGDIGRKSLVTPREVGWMCGTGCMRLRPNPEVVDPRFFFTTIGREDVMGVIAGRAQGAIMPNLNLGILADIALVLPPKSLQQQFLDYGAPVHRQIEILQNQNEKLRTARDILLPRLMSGEIAV